MKALIILIILVLSGVANAQHGNGQHGESKKNPVWLDDGLGGIDHPVTTKSAEAQKYFNQGLAYLFAFNHAEGIASFRHAAELDPEMAMAYWGMSLGLGANYNDPANTDRFAQAYVELKKAVALAPKVSPAEQAYIAALSKRYSPDPKADPKALAAAYKAAMADLVKQYPDDLDAATLYAESMMNLRPWQLWTLDGKPAEGTLEIIAVLEGVLKRNPRHTGANHYYIHAVEAWPNPQRGTAAADRLLGLAPNAGHLVHMPSHIYLLTGDHEAAVKSNDLAIIADRNYIERSGSTGIYPLMYFNHNLHMLAASHAEAGNYAGAIKAANEFAANVGPNVKAMPMLEMFMPYPIITLTRFRKWDEAMRYPKPADGMLITLAHWHMMRGLALAESGKPDDAERELAAMRETAKKIPAEATLFTTPVSVVLKVADELVAGRIALSRGNNKRAIDLLRAAEASEAKVNYAEPPDWDIPVREWLGPALLKDGQFAEAEKTFRTEIDKNPRNGRALFGLAEALARQGKITSSALVRKEFASAWSNADTKLSSDAFAGDSSSFSSDLRPNKVKLKTGITMNYVESGPADGPPVILLHGITDSWVSFSQVLPMIDRKFRVYALDQRGHGDTDKPESGYEIKNFAADVAAFMDAKSIEEAILVGHSMGSFVAMKTALDYPTRVEQLVLIGTAPKAYKPEFEELVVSINKLKDPVPKSFARGFVIATSSPTVPTEFVDWLTDETMKLPARVWKRALAGLSAADFSADLGRIKVPVAIFWGAEETFFVRSDQDSLMNGLADSQLIVYPKAGHAPHWEEPKKFAEDLNRILTKTGDSDE